MRIAFAASTPRTRNAGVAGVTLNLGTAMQELGAEVDFVFLDDLPTTGRGLVDKILFPLRLSVRRDFWGYDVIDTSCENILQEYVRRGPVCVSRNHGLEATAHIGRVRESQAGGPKLSWKYPIYHGGYSLWEEKMSLRHADLALLLNKNDHDYAISALGVHPDRAHTVANGLPDNFLGLPFLEEPDDLGDAVRIAFVGSHIHRKGVSYLSPALDAVLKRHPGARVGFFGTGRPVDEVLAGYSPEVQERIEVVPRFEQKDLPAMLSGCSINVFPSLSEGFPIALLEVMACGLVPVVSAIPGPTEFCRDQQNALLVPPRDSAAIEQALTLLLCDAPLRRRLRREAHATVQGYSWRRIAGETLQLYEAALSAKKRLT